MTKQQPQPEQQHYEHECIKYDMCHIVKSRIRHKNTKRAYCVKEEGYDCAFFINKKKPQLDEFTNMNCYGCEAERCAEVCQEWLKNHDEYIRSRPAPAPHKTNVFFEPLLNCDCEVCKDAREAHDAAIAAQARKDILDKLQYGGLCKMTEEIDRAIESLRQQDPPR